MGMLPKGNELEVPTVRFYAHQAAWRLQTNRELAGDYKKAGSQWLPALFWTVRLFLSLLLLGSRLGGILDPRRRLCTATVRRHAAL